MLGRVAPHRGLKQPHKSAGELHEILDALFPLSFALEFGSRILYIFIMSYMCTRRRGAPRARTRETRADFMQILPFPPNKIRLRAAASVGLKSRKKRRL